MRHRLSDYSLLLWIIFVFLGGIVNAMAIRIFTDYCLSVNDYLKSSQLTIWQAPQIIPQLIICFATLFSVPIVLSLLLSRTHPEKRVVPPYYMQLIAFGLLTFFVYNQLPTDFLILYVIFIYVITSGPLQDGIATYAIGKTVFTDNIIRHSWKIHTTINRVKDMVLSKQFLKLNNLKVIRKPKGESIKLKTKNRRGFILILELKEGKVNKETIVNLVVYHLQAYFVKPITETDDVYMWAMDRIAIFRDNFARRLSVRVDDDTISNVDSLLNFVLDDMAGAISRFQEMATTRRITMIFSGVLILISIGFFAIGRFDVGFGPLAIAIALIVDVILRK